MRNNKGFTLMELVAAIFIGGMVTAALILIWKTASVQTSQGQRQTIIRNQISNFQRQLYRDFYGADIITWPNANTASQPVLLLTGIKKAKQLDEEHFQAFNDIQPKGPTKEFCYWIDGQTIKRCEHKIAWDPENADSTENAENGILNLSGYDEECLNTCPVSNNGVVSDVLTNFVLTSATLTNGYNYNLKGVVKRTFVQASGTTPIYIEIDETLLKQGGI